MTNPLFAQFCLLHWNTLTSNNHYLLALFYIIFVFPMDLWILLTQYYMGNPQSRSAQGLVTPQNRSLDLKLYLYITNTYTLLLIFVMGIEKGCISYWVGICTYIHAYMPLKFVVKVRCAVRLYFIMSTSTHNYLCSYIPYWILMRCKYFLYR